LSGRLRGPSADPRIAALSRHGGVRPLRIVYFGSYDRGTGRNAILAAGLEAAGVEIVSCHVSVWPSTAAKLDAVRRGRATAAALARHVAAWPRLVGRHARVGAYDVLVVGATGHLDLPLARWLTRRRGRPLVFDPLVSATETVRDRGLLPEASRRLAALGAIERALFRLPDLCLVDTAAHTAAFRHDLGLDPSRTLVVPASAPPVFRRLATPYVAREGRPVRVVYFGQFIPLHGLENVLGAAALLRARDDIRIDLVGLGQTLDANQDLARRLDLPNVRFFPQWLAPEALAEAHIAAADVCLGVFGGQPKAQRVVPFKVYTALAAGRAVVTADTPAVRELLAPGDEVWTVPPASPPALATAIARLAGDPALRTRLATAGQSAWDARFAPPVLGARLRQALEALVVASTEDGPSGGRAV